MQGDHVAIASQHDLRGRRVELARRVPHLDLQTANRTRHPLRHPESKHQPRDASQSADTDQSPSGPPQELGMLVSRLLEP